MPVGIKMYKPSYSPIYTFICTLQGIRVRTTNFDERDKLRREREKEKEEKEERLRRMIDATRLFVYLANVMDHGLTSASRFLERSPLRKTNAQGNVENYS